MSLLARITALAQAIGADIKALSARPGAVSALVRKTGAYESWHLAGSPHAASVNVSYTPSDGVVVCTPFVTNQAVTFDAIGVRVATAQTGGLARIGIAKLSADELKPTDLVLDAGEVSCATTGAKTKSISLTLQPGVYGALLVCNSGVAFFGTNSSSGYMAYGAAPGLSVARNAALCFDTYRAFPANLSSLDFIPDLVTYLVFLRRSA